MDFVLTENGGVGGVVDIIIGLMCFLELLTHYSILFSTALPNHTDLQDLRYTSHEAFASKIIRYQSLRGRRLKRVCKELAPK